MSYDLGKMMDNILH